MLTKTHTITAYYLIMGLSLTLMMIYTLYQSSRAVSYGQYLSSLEDTKQELVEKRSQLNLHLAQATSLETVKASELLVAYQPISQTMAITTFSTVASR